MPAHLAYLQAAWAAVFVSALTASVVRRPRAAAGLLVAGGAVAFVLFATWQVAVPGTPVWLLLLPGAQLLAAGTAVRLAS